MKKTFTANLNGTVFHIEEDAYDQLQRYLANIRAKFSGSGEAEEIMADIEARIAELFTERLQGRQAVSMADVDHVKQVMGQPEDYVDGESDTADAPPGSGGGYRQHGPRRRKRLYRDPDDRWLGGVIGGLANFFGTDPLWFRIAFIAVLIAGWGSPVLIYLLMWALVPKALTAAEKLEMHGEEVTVDNIKRMFDEGADRVKAGAETMAGEAREMGRRFWRQGSAQGRDMGRRAESAGHRLLDALGKVLGVFLLLLAVVIGLSLITAIAGGTATWSNGDLTGASGPFGFLSFIFPSGAQAGGFLLAALVLGLVPVVLLLLAALWLLFRISAPRWAGWVLSALFIAALAAVAWFSVRLATDFRAKGSDRSELAIPVPANGLLKVRMEAGHDNGSEWSMDYRHGVFRLDLDLLRIRDGEAQLRFSRLQVEPSPDSTFHLITVRDARGFRAEEARERAQHIQARYAWSEDEGLRLAGSYAFPLRDKLRAQRVRYVLQVPLHGRVHFHPGTRSLMHGAWIGFDEDRWRADDLAGHTWEMTPNGLRKVQRGPAPLPTPPPDGQEPEAPSAISAARPAPDPGPPFPSLVRLLAGSVRI